VTDAQTQGPAGEGTEPDPRFTFANERTFLAWSRTALALVVALIVLGAVVAVAAYGDWVRNQRALRLGRPLPRSIMPWLLAAVITIIAVIAAVVVLASALR
jgi:putative membrane protein